MATLCVLHSPDVIEMVRGAGPADRYLAHPSLADPLEVMHRASAIRSGWALAPLCRIAEGRANLSQATGLDTAL